MGRLFWKIFFGLWLTLIITGAGVGAIIHWHQQERIQTLTELSKGPRTRLMVSTLAAVLTRSGTDAAEDLLMDDPGGFRPEVLVVDADGHDLFGRSVPEAAYSKAKEAAPDEISREVTTPDGKHFLLFSPADEHEHRHREFDRRPPPDIGNGFLGEGRRPPPPPQPRSWFGPYYIRLLTALLASILFSLGLAWYISRPVRVLRAASLRLADGKLDTRVGASMGRRRDEITDLGQDFDHMAEQLQDLISAQKRLLNDVSHELRSPLARMRIAIGLARQQPLKLEQSLERIELEAERLDTLVGELLTLSRLESGSDHDANEYLDVSSLLDTIVEDARFETKQGRIVFSPDTSECIVKGRAELLRRALENVIRNAITHTPEGSPVNVGTERINGDWVRVSICDRGPGVPEAQLGKLFEPFSRAGNNSSTGYGLGLAIARRAIQAHGGKIAASNRLEGGLCVTIELPLTPLSTE